MQHIQSTITHPKGQVGRKILTKPPHTWCVSSYGTSYAERVAVYDLLVSLCCRMCLRDDDALRNLAENFLVHNCSVNGYNGSKWYADSSKRQHTLYSQKMLFRVLHRYLNKLIWINVRFWQMSRPVVFTCFTCNGEHANGLTENVTHRNCSRECTVCVILHLHRIWITTKNKKTMALCRNWMRSQFCQSFITCVASRITTQAYDKIHFTNM